MLLPSRTRLTPACATVCRHTVFGVAFGLCFPVMAVGIDLFLHDTAPSWRAVRHLFASNPIHAIVALAPLVLGMTHNVIGRSRAALEAELDRRGRAEAAMRHRAFHDELTGLSNRAFLYEALRTPEGRLGRALVLLDLDAFKHVNDTLGHLAGDELLRAVARRLEATLAQHGTVVRLGGDEFALLCGGAAEASDLRRVTEEVVGAFARPFRVGQSELRCGASLGASFVQPDDAGPADVIRRADVALYEAKADGRGGWKLYDAGTDARAQARVRLEADLRTAVARGEFVLHYQPLQDIHGGRLTGFEALIRWTHPSRGLVAPDEFIPLAEETGLIAEIGRWALREACTAAASWPDPIGVAVNVSPAQLAGASLAGDVRAALEATGLAPGRLMLEITESLFAKDYDGVAPTLHEVSAMGVRLALDDFGTGYSSLGHLRHLPVDVVKIDRSFVRGIADDPADAMIVAAIIGLAKGLRMEVTAEGVETAAQLEAARALGADTAQGFLFSKPVTGDQAADMAMACSGGGRGTRAATA